MARSQLSQQVVERWRQQVGQPAAGACGGNQLGLQAPLAARQVDLSQEVIGRDLGARRDEHGRERRGAALVVLLREERRRFEFDARRQT